ncbi:MAG: NAD(P)H-hydrate dehydratase [Thermomicrobiales bacterium]
MTVLVTPDEMYAAERRTIDAGTTADALMRRAAEAIASWIDRHVMTDGASARRITGLVGPGNNGGDALVALGILSRSNWLCEAVTVHRNEPGDLPLTDIERAGVVFTETPNLANCDVILDGVFGYRSRPTLPPDIAVLFRGINAVRAARPVPIVAIDVPSGIDAGVGEAAVDTLRADVTLCLGLPKLGITREPAASMAGELIVIDIGIEPPEIHGRAMLLDRASVSPMLPRRRATAHKHGTGAVLIVGGAPTYYGAPRLSAEAALRAGAGLVAAAVPQQIAPVLASQAPETVLAPLSDENQLRAILDFVAERESTLHALVVGPGLGRSAAAASILDGLLSERAPAPIRRLTKVVDADALNWMSGLAGPPDGLEPGSAVLTPHPGELARLMHTDPVSILGDPVHWARETAAHFGQVVVLKSGYSPVARPNGDVWLAQRATPELATAGTGDVLAGLIGGLLAQGLSPWDAARVAVYSGAEAGRRAARHHGTMGTVARDVIDEIGGVLRDLAEPVWRT